MGAIRDLALMAGGSGTTVFSLMDASPNPSLTILGLVMAAAPAILARVDDQDLVREMNQAEITTPRKIEVAPVHGMTEGDRLWLEAQSILINDGREEHGDRSGLTVEERRAGHERLKEIFVTGTLEEKTEKTEKPHKHAWVAVKNWRGIRSWRCAEEGCREKTTTNPYTQDLIEQAVSGRFPLVHNAPEKVAYRPAYRRCKGSGSHQWNYLGTKCKQCRKKHSKIMEQTCELGEHVWSYHPMGAGACRRCGVQAGDLGFSRMLSSLAKGDRIETAADYVQQRKKEKALEEKHKQASAPRINAATPKASSGSSLEMKTKWTCSICGLITESITAHMERVHPGMIRQFICDYCDVQKDDPEQIERHIERVHATEFLTLKTAVTAVSRTVTGDVGTTSHEIVWLDGAETGGIVKWVPVTDPESGEYLGAVSWGAAEGSMQSHSHKCLCAVCQTHRPNRQVRDPFMGGSEG